MFLSRREMLAHLSAVPALGWVASVASASPSRAQAFSGGGLRGFNIGGPSHLNAEGLAALERSGANLARVAFPFRRCAACAAFERSDADELALSRLLEQCAALDIQLVIAAWFDRVDEAAFWFDGTLQSSAVAQWSWLAQRFGSHPVVAGLDLLNEPNPPWPGGNLRQAQTTWEALAGRFVKAIRAEAPRTPVVYQPVVGASPLGLRDALPLADDNVVYSIHFYLPHDITHQRVAPLWPRNVPYPAGMDWRLPGGDPALGVGAFDKPRLEREMAPALAFSLKHKVPIYVGEFSCVRWAPGRSAYRWIADCLALFTAYGWSWTYHEFRGWPGWDAEIDSQDPAVITRSPTAPIMQLLTDHLPLPS